MENDKSIIFEQGSPLKTYLTLALPVIISMLITVVYSLADTYFVSQTQNTLLVAGVSICGPIFTILMAFGNIFGQGGSSLIARLFGANNIDDTRSVCSFCFWLSIVTGIVIGGLMLLLPDFFLELLGADAETMPYAKPYYLTMAAGAPILIVHFIPMNLLRAEGRARESMIGSVSGVALNIILDPILILVFKLGAFGAALASVLGYVLSDIVLITILVKKSEILSVDPKKAHVSGNFIWQIVSVGISAAVTNWMSSICAIIMNHFLLAYGNDQVAALGLASRVLMVPTMIATGMVFGSAPIIGYYYGGRRWSELKKMLRMILLLVEGVTFVISVVLFLAARPAISFFLNDETVVTAGMLMVRFQCVTLCLAAFVMMVTVCMQASGRGLAALVISLLRQGVVLLGSLFILAKIFGYMGVISAQAVSDVITTIAVSALFYFAFLKKLK